MKSRNNNLDIKYIAKAFFEEYLNNRANSWVAAIGDYTAAFTFSQKPKDIKEGSAKTFLDNIAAANSFESWQEIVESLGCEAQNPKHTEYRKTLHAVRTLIVALIARDYAEDYKNKISELENKLKMNIEEINKKIKENIRIPAMMLSNRSEFINSLLYLQHHPTITDKVLHRTLKVESKEVWETIKLQLPNDHYLMKNNVPLFYDDIYYEIYRHTVIKGDEARKNFYQNVLLKQLSNTTDDFKEPLINTILPFQIHTPTSVSSTPSTLFATPTTDNTQFAPLGDQNKAITPNNHS